LSVFSFQSQVLSLKSLVFWLSVHSLSIEIGRAESPQPFAK
jgi:hypothetical protein